MIRRHLAALLLAFAIGATAIGPYMFFALTSSHYAGIAMIGQDAEEYYVARIHEIYEGHFSLGNVFLPYKEVPYLVPGLGEQIIAGMGKVIGVSAVVVNLISKFLFPFIVALCIYGLAFELFSSRAIALAATAVAMFGQSILSNPPELLSIFHGTSIADGVYWARPINPEVSGIFLFASLWIIYRYFIKSRPQEKWPGVLLGILFGASLYVSIYIWSFIGVVILLLFAYFLYKREYARAQQLLIAGILGAVLTIPFITNHLQAIAYPGYLAASMQQGLVASHAFIFGIWVSLLFLPLVLWPKSSPQEARVFFIACAVALLLLLNQQVITGTLLQSGHFHWYITKPLIGILLAAYGIWIAEYVIKKPSSRRYVAVLVISVCIIDSILAQAHFYALNAQAASASQAYAPVLSYLNVMPGNSVVYADRTLSAYIPMYTNADAPNNYYSGLSIDPPRYLENRLFLAYKLRGIKPEDVRAIMYRERSAISEDLFGLYWAARAGNYAAIPDSDLDTLSQKYVAIFQTPLSQMAHDLGITMIIKDRKLDQSWDISAQKGLALTNIIDDRFEICAIGD